MSNPPIRVAAIGECMIELSDLGQGTMSLNYGGDSLNTSVYLARLGSSRNISVDYFTALGDDPYSDAMIEMWQGEGIGTRNIPRLPGKLPGLYTIRTDDRGERSFYYWRSASAAREMLRGDRTDNLSKMLKEYDVVYVTGVTLSILDKSDRSRLVVAVDGARTSGARVVFDSNYRPRGWQDAATARTAMQTFYHRVDIALPTLEDEASLFGYASAGEVVSALRKWGITETVVKDGARPSVADCDGDIRQFPVNPVPHVVDTTAAGDAFNAAYLAARLGQVAAEDAVRAGQTLAAAVIQHRGAIIPCDAMPEIRHGS